MTEYCPTPLLDVYKGDKNIKVDTDREISCNTEFHDASGDDSLASKRQVNYKGADGLLICVSKDNYDSFANIDKWKQEFEAIQSGRPIFLILTKDDIPDKDEDAQVTFEKLREYRSTQAGFTGAFKTSAKDDRVDQAFKSCLKKTYLLKYTD